MSSRSHCSLGIYQYCRELNETLLAVIPHIRHIYWYSESRVRHNIWWEYGRRPLRPKEIRGMAGKFVDTISIFNRKIHSVKMNISGFAKILHEQIDEVL